METNRLNSNNDLMCAKEVLLEELHSDFFILQADFCTDTHTRSIRTHRHILVNGHVII